MQYYYYYYYFHYHYYAWRQSLRSCEFYVHDELSTIYQRGDKRVSGSGSVSNFSQFLRRSVGSPPRDDLIDCIRFRTACRYVAHNLNWNNVWLDVSVSLQSRWLMVACAENMQNWLLARQVERVGWMDESMICQSQRAFKASPDQYQYSHISLSPVTNCISYIVYRLSLEVGRTEVPILNSFCLCYLLCMCS